MCPVTNGVSIQQNESIASLCLLNLASMSNYIMPWQCGLEQELAQDQAKYGLWD